MSGMIDRAIAIAGQQYYSSDDRAIVVQAAVELLRKHAPKALGPALDRMAGGLIYEADRPAIEKVRDGAPLSEAERRVLARAWKLMGFVSGSAPEPIPEPPPDLAQKIAEAKGALERATAEWHKAQAELEALRAESRRDLAEMTRRDDGTAAPWADYVEREKLWAERIVAAEHREKTLRERAQEARGAWHNLDHGYRTRALWERSARAAGVLR